MIIFLFPLGSLSHCGIFENGVLLIILLEGVSSVATVILLMKNLNNTETHIFFICNVVFFVTNGYRIFFIIIV